MSRLRVLLIIVALMSLIESRRSKHRKERKQSQPEIDSNGDVVYDYNLQVLEIPGAVCKYRHCVAQFLGDLPTDAINYHGVWPDRIDGKHPFFCANEKYNPDKVDDITFEAMQKNWVGLYNSTFWFRYHEYTKHGTCFTVPSWIKEDKAMKTQKTILREPITFNVVSQKKKENKKGFLQSLFTQTNYERVMRLVKWIKNKINPQPRFNEIELKTEMNYEVNHQDLFFKSAEEMFKRSKMQENLFRKSKTEESIWTVQELKEMVHNAMGVTDYSMMCHYDKNERKSYLQEFRFCWDKHSLTPINCPSGYKSTCRATDQIIVLPYNKENFNL